MLVYHITEEETFQPSPYVYPLDCLGQCWDLGLTPRGCLFAVCDEELLKSICQQFWDALRRRWVAVMDISSLDDDDFVQGSWFPEELIIKAEALHKVKVVEMRENPHHNGKGLW